MKNLEIEQLEETDELNADDLISSRIGNKAAIEHVKMRNTSIDTDWIRASESLLE